MLSQFGVLAFSPKRFFFFFLIRHLILSRNIKGSSISLIEGKRDRSWAVIRPPCFRYNGPGWARRLDIYFSCWRWRKENIHFINLLMQNRWEHVKTHWLWCAAYSEGTSYVLTLYVAPSVGPSVHSSIHLIEFALVHVLAFASQSVRACACVCVRVRAVRAQALCACMFRACACMHCVRPRACAASVRVSAGLTCVRVRALCVLAIIDRK